MSTLADWNQLPEANALAPVLACCGSNAFAAAVTHERPYSDVNSLLATADDIWWSLAERDWLEAFACHPRIGESAGQRLSPVLRVVDGRAVQNPHRSRVRT